MSDGTTGPLKETTFKGGTKTPIAVVIDKATHIAMALKEADNGAKPEWCKGPYWNIKTNTNMIWGQDIRERAQSGLDETWDASYSTGTIGVKATNPNFPAFNAAVAYNHGSYRLARIEMVPAVVHRLAVHLCRIRLRRSGSGNQSKEEL